MKPHKMRPPLKVFLCSTSVLISLVLGFFICLMAQAGLAQASSGPKPTAHGPQSCEKALTLPWHPMAEFYGEKGFSYKSVLKRFAIHSHFQGQDNAFTAKEKVSLFFQDIDKTYTEQLTNGDLKQQLKDQWLERAVIDSLSESYMALFKRVGAERGMDIIDGDIDWEQTLTVVRESQASSFLGWFDYIDVHKSLATFFHMWKRS